MCLFSLPLARLHLFQLPPFLFFCLSLSECQHQTLQNMCLLPLSRTARQILASLGAGQGMFLWHFFLLGAGFPAFQCQAFQRAGTFWHFFLPSIFSCYRLFLT